MLDVTEKGGFFMTRSFNQEEWLFVLAHDPSMSVLNKWRFFNFIKNQPHKSVDELVVGWNQTGQKKKINSRFFLNFNSQEQRFQLDKRKIQWVSFLSPDYPEALSHIYEPPLGLFVMGDLRLLSQPSLAVVGSRKATAYGKNVLKKILPDLVKKDWVIVSGLARGIDTCAHNICLEEGGKTIAVLANGLDKIYPRENDNLQLKIADSHCLVTEYPLKTAPLKRHFPMRNRIISGLSRGTFVVEAKYRSGSLITAHLALQEGREVFAVPGHIFSENSEGTNDLIKHGATSVLNSQDILNELVLYSRN